jgi:hypothetical protein
MDNKERSWDEMQRHIHSCEKHPLTQAESQLAEIAELPCATHFYPEKGESVKLVRHDAIQAIINREKCDE